MADKRTVAGTVANTAHDKGKRVVLSIDTGGQFGPQEIGCGNWEKDWVEKLKSLKQGQEVAISQEKNDKGFWVITSIEVSEPKGSLDLVEGLAKSAGFNTTPPSNPREQSIERQVIVKEMGVWAHVFLEMNKKISWDEMKQKLQEVVSMQKAVLAGESFENMEPSAPSIPEDRFANAREPEEQEEV